MNIRSIKNLPILTESISIDIIPTSRGGIKQEDIAKITANIRLVNPLQEETKFLVPKVEGNTSPKIYLPDGTKLTQDTLDPADETDLYLLPTEINDAVQTFISNPEVSNLTAAVNKMAIYSDYKVNSEVIIVPSGSQYITFSYSKWVPTNENGEFLLETVVPFVDFTLASQAGAKANITVLMPIELTDINNNILEATWVAPNGVPENLNRNYLDGRIILSRYWQYDPAVKVRYKY